MPTIATRLDLPADARVLIVKATDLGLCHAANLGVYQGLRQGNATSSSLMVPAPWSREAASRFRGDDVGVQLTLNAEHDRYRWGPITQAPSLLDGDGGFPRTLSDVWDHADLDEVRRECRAQVERAVLWGFDISHLDAHRDALLLRPEFFDIYLETAVDFALPMRLVNAEEESNIGFPLRRLATEAGVLFPDRSEELPSRPDLGALRRLLDCLQPGITELALRPAIDTPEIRAVTDDWDSRIADHRLLLDSEFARLASQAGVVLTGYRRLREAMQH